MNSKADFATLGVEVHAIKELSEHNSAPRLLLDRSGTTINTWAPTGWKHDGGDGFWTRPWYYETVEGVYNNYFATDQSVRVSSIPVRSYIPSGIYISSAIETANDPSCLTATHCGALVRFVCSDHLILSRRIGEKDSRIRA